MVERKHKHGHVSLAALMFTHRQVSAQDVTSQASYPTRLAALLALAAALGSLFLHDQAVLVQLPTLQGHGRDLCLKRLCAEE